ncbi:MAG TPA: hypothetical protein VE820_02525 [Sphingomicrobium sp.]|jgi:hypothetical protein|nr:hypothetical protein [Sphingomicrobium sp.]
MLPPVAFHAPDPAPPRAVATATATVRIERPATASSKDWDHAPKSARRELVVHDKDGQTVLLRLVEYE